MCHAAKLLFLEKYHIYSEKHWTEDNISNNTHTTSPLSPFDSLQIQNKGKTAWALSKTRLTAWQALVNHLITGFLHRPPSTWLLQLFSQCLTSELRLGLIPYFSPHLKVRFIISIPRGTWKLQICKKANTNEQRSHKHIKRGEISKITSSLSCIKI